MAAFGVAWFYLARFCRRATEYRNSIHRCRSFLCHCDGARKRAGECQTIALGSSSGGGGIPAFTMTTNSDGSEDYSINLQILALMTMLGFLPAMVILMTSFTRIVVVMSILRQAWVCNKRRLTK